MSWHKGFVATFHALLKLSMETHSPLSHGLIREEKECRICIWHKRMEKVINQGYEEL